MNWAKVMKQYVSVGHVMPKKIFGATSDQNLLRDEDTGSYHERNRVIFTLKESFGVLKRIRTGTVRGSVTSFSSLLKCDKYVLGCSGLLCLVVVVPVPFEL